MQDLLISTIHIDYKSYAFTYNLFNINYSKPI